MAFNTKTFITRTLSAIVFVSVLLACIYFNYLSFSFLFFIVSLWGLLEFYSISKKLGAKPFKIMGFICAALLYATGLFSNSNLSLFYSHSHLLNGVIACVFLIFIIALFSKNESPVNDVAYTIAGIVYTTLPLVLLNNVACIDRTYTFSHHTGNWYEDVAPYNKHFILGIVFLIWINDTCAYLCGSFFGKHKLYEKISPGKTWEGSIGGAILTLGLSYLISLIFSELAFAHWLAIAFIVVVFGTIGDLFESLLKRQAGIKDSGSIMPGHGGILDRFDSLLFVSPFVYFYLNLIVG